MRDLAHAPSSEAAQSERDLCPATPHHDRYLFARLDPGVLDQFRPSLKL
jgi:hypothetical protein